MKKLIVLILILVFSFNLFSQKPRLEIQLINGKNTVLLLNPNNNKIDTFVKIWSKAKLIDTFLNDSIVLFIIETPWDYTYMKYFKTDTGWVWSWTSGTLSSNPNEITSAVSKYYRGYQKVTAKIISDDKVYLKIGDRETIKDCNDFKLEREAKMREYQEWLKSEEEKKEDKKKKKESKLDKKEFEKIK